MTEGIPKYMKEGWEESRWKRIIRFRLGNEMRERLYWEKEKKRLCRLCGSEEESWVHVWERCRDWEKGGNFWRRRVANMLKQAEARGNGSPCGGCVCSVRQRRVCG